MFHSETIQSHDQRNFARSTAHLMASLHALRTKARTASRRCAIPTTLLDGYVQFYDDNSATHALTITLGFHPRTFNPEVDFIPQMRRVAREIARRLRQVPKRKLLDLRPEDAVWMAGFYEATDAAGMLFPHWHGVISLNEGEELRLRELLTECVGEDSTPGFSPIGATDRPVITTPKAKPTFDLQPLKTSSRYIAYATKKVIGADPIHWTINDFLHRAS